MNKRIWKYHLKLTDLQTIELPEGTKVLTVQVQDNSLQLYVLFGLEDYDFGETIRKAERQFAVVGTGNVIPDLKLDYINTVQTHGGTYVWHVFEVV